MKHRVRPPFGRTGGRTGSRTGKGNQSGFTLAELAIAMTMLIVALVSISAATLRAHSLRRQNRDRVLANTAVRSVSERIHSLAYRTIEDGNAAWAQEILGTYGPGGTVGNTFDVLELNPVGANGQVGTITIVIDETTTDAALGVELGLPRDLNGDGDATDTDVSADARILPVIIDLTYRSESGTATENHAFFAVGF